MRSHGDQIGSSMLGLVEDGLGSVPWMTNVLMRRPAREKRSARADISR